MTDTTSVTSKNASSLSLATSDLHDYNENIALLSNKDENPEIEMSIPTASTVSFQESDIVRYGKQFKPQTTLKENNYTHSDNSDDSDEKILNGDSDTGLYKEKTTKAILFAKTKTDLQNYIHQTADQFCQTLKNPHLTFIKDKHGKHKGVLRIYGKSFSYKQITGFAIFLISFVLIVSAIGINSWTFCEGATASEHPILVIWSHNKLSISVGEKASNSMKFNSIVHELNNVDHSDMLKPLPTVFDDDYDYTKWPLIQEAVNAESDKRDLISLLEWSQNDRIKDIDYGLNLMNIFNIICVCFLGILMFIMIVFGDTYYKYEYLLTFICFLFIILSIIYWGIANKHIEQYNPLLWCHTGDSFIVLSTGMANLFLILFIFTLPKKYDLHKYDLKKSKPKIANYSIYSTELSDIPTSILSKQSFSTQQITKHIEKSDDDEVSLGDTITNKTKSEINSIDMDNSVILSEDGSYENPILGEVETQKLIESKDSTEKLEL